MKIHYTKETKTLQVSVSMNDLFVAALLVGAALGCWSIL